MDIHLPAAETYRSALPFPHCAVRHALSPELARAVQAEILEMPVERFSRYDNPFEQKWFLVDKEDLPPATQMLFDYLVSQEWLDRLSQIVGHRLVNDPDKNFWGIHVFDNGDHLDVHCDAGQHPKTGQKKQVTLGLYLSHRWLPEYGGALELWSGDDASLDDAALHRKEVQVACDFNTMVVFTCTDRAWHGAPEPVCSPKEARRIFLTLSYLSDNQDYNNRRPKAFFRRRPQDPDDPEVEKLRLARADPQRYQNVYRMGGSVS
ncbi:MAG: 2OG-Fe(II) oxygenase [Sulfobacillus sp.]